MATPAHEPTEKGLAQVYKARVARLENAALRAVDDPATLAKAARIVRAALARQALTEDDLRGDIVKPSDIVPGGSTLPTRQGFRVRGAR